MKKAAFQQLIKEVQQGQEQGLATVYSMYYETCVRQLQQSYEIMLEDAEDAFMEAMLVFRQQLIADTVKHQNIGGYLFIVAKNKWLERKRQQKSYLYSTLNIDEVDRFFGRHIDVYDEASFDPMIQLENIAAGERAKQLLIHQVTSTYQQLGKKCQQLLKGFIIDKVSLKVLQKRLGYGTYNSIKASKNRCKHQFIKKYKELCKDIKDSSEQL